MLRDCANASRTVSGPGNLLSKTCDLLPESLALCPPGNGDGMSHIILAGFQPLPNAVTCVNGLRVDPGWRGDRATLTCPAIDGWLNLTETSRAITSPVHA